MSASWSGSAQGQPGLIPGVKTATAPALPQYQNEKVTLSVLARSVGRYPPYPAAISNDQDVANLFLPPAAAPGDFLTLLTGKLDDFNKYAGHEHSAWLLDIAHGICDPRHERGMLLVYDPQQTRWTSVAASAPLLAASYIYYLDPGQGHLLSLTKICLRDRRSHTDTTGNGSSMQARVRTRDSYCWVSGMGIDSCTNSHICPKRLGDALAKRILEDFTRGPITVPPQVSIFDPIFGILLANNLDNLFDNFFIGFRYRGPNVYECHDFSAPAGNDVLSTIGSVPMNSPILPVVGLLHGHMATPPNPQVNDLPPPSVFRWNYIQCVVKKFKHPDYKNFANIYMPSLQVQFESDDSDNSHGYCDGGPPDWPTAIFDIGRAAMADAEEERVRMVSVAAWAAVSAVVSDS